MSYHRLKLGADKMKDSCPWCTKDSLAVFRRTRRWGSNYPEERVVMQLTGLDRHNLGLLQASTKMPSAICVCIFFIFNELS